MISNIVNLTPTAIEIEPTGINKILGFQGRIVIPFSHVKKVSISYGALNDEGKGWRVAGTSLFNKSVGFYSKNGVSFYVNIWKNELPPVFGSSCS